MFKDLFNLFNKKPTAPEQEGLGALPNDPDPRDIQLDSFQEDVDIPERFVTDISIIEVYNQGSLGTCVAHVFALIKQFNEYLDTKKLISFSRRFIYHIARKISGYLQSSNEGLPPRTAVKGLVDTGACETSFWPEVKASHSDYSLPFPTSPAMENALDYRVKGYAFGGEGEQSIKRALINNGLLGISLPVDRKAWDRKTGKVSKPDENNFTGRHYVTLFGYEGSRFYFRNSWGKTWGNNGNGYFEFEDYEGLIRDVVAITDIPQKLIEEAKNKKYVFTATLRKGDRGEAVKQLQKKLTELDFFSSKIDGHFGELTKSAVFMFQLAHDLSPDGIAGPKTNAILNGMNTPKPKMKLVDALIQVESGGSDNAIGDKHLTDKAYGCLQIRKPCVDDVNKVFGTNYKAQDCLGNRQISLYIFDRYMELYAVERKLGRPVTDEDRARIWNGGPTGWKRDSTIPYWEKVEKLLNKM